jgi:predicted ATPase
MQRIVFTGGPGAGKTSVCALFARQHPRRFAPVPEAATQVYERLRTRWDRLDDAARRDVQRQICALQVEQEQRAAREQPGQTLLLDRGTVDGSAYWPAGPDDYWRSMNLSREAELARYDAVVWMESCAAVGAYDGSLTNSVRHEDAAAALACGEGLRRAWAGHPRFIEVRACSTFDEKVARVEHVLRHLGVWVSNGDE